MLEKTQDRLDSPDETSSVSSGVQSTLAVVRPLNDTILLVLFAVCWLAALFPPLPESLGIAAAGRVASAVAMTMVFINWTFRPELRPGWRWRDLGLVILLLLTAFQAHRAPIRHVAMLDLLQMLELVSIYIVALYLTIHRPQPFFVILLLLLAFSTALAYSSRDKSIFAYLDTVTLAEITIVMALAMLPWLVPLTMKRFRMPYLWLILGVIGLLTIFEAGGFLREQSSWSQWLNLTFPGPTRRFLGDILRHAGILGLGPDHYDWLFRAYVSEDYLHQSEILPGFLIILIERGLIGLIALFGFAVAMLWRLHPGEWAKDHPDVTGMAQPLRAAAAFAWLLFFATSELRSGFGFIMLWSLTGMVRAWSSKRPIAAISLVSGQSTEAEKAAPLFSRRLWSSKEIFLVMAALLAILGMTFLHVAPWVAGRLTTRPDKMDKADPDYFDRLDLARFFWPYDPRIYKMITVHIRGKVDIGQTLTSLDIESVTQAYSQLIRSNPYDPFSHQSLADWYIRQGRPNEAIETLKRGLAYVPASLELRYWLAGLYRRTGQGDQAVQALLEARAWYPNSIKLLAELADLELARSNFNEAEYYLNLARQIDPEHAEVRRLTKELRKRGRP